MCHNSQDLNFERVKKALSFLDHNPGEYLINSEWSRKA